MTVCISIIVFMNSRAKRFGLGAAEQALGVEALAASVSDIAAEADAMSETHPGMREAQAVSTTLVERDGAPVVSTRNTREQFGGPLRSGHGSLGIDRGAALPPGRTNP